MKLTSYGAALEVTGSQHLLEVNGKKILLDCGLFQGSRKKAFAKNQEFGFDATSVDAVLVSHAHIDHTGNIPTLVKRGFQGVVYCTKATERLCEVMLQDSAYIQEQDAAYMAKRHSDTALQPIEPLYTQEDAELTMDQFKGMDYNKPFELYPGIQVTFVEAGHVLGSSMIVLEIDDQEDGKKKKLVYTGDLGRCRLPILQDPANIEQADYLICESTYGNRTHEEITEGVPALARIINRTAERGGKIIIPAFALERTQELIYSIHLLMHKKEIPENIQLFLDSPLASKITGIFKEFTNLYDKDIKEEFKTGHNPFNMRQLKITQSVDESKALNFYIGPCIIISASGMMEAGRIRHHLKNNIEDPKNTIVVVGYQAENTLGRKIVEHAEAIKIFDQMYDVKAEVVVLESFSAHADMKDLDRVIQGIKGLKKVILVHGEEDQSRPLAERIEANTDAKAIVQEPMKTIDL